MYRAGGGGTGGGGGFLEALRLRRFCCSRKRFLRSSRPRRALSGPRERVLRLLSVTLFGGSLRPRGVLVAMNGEPSV